ncbi:hypothetical protein [Pseudomonas sp.]|uniref:hypothetical protein n=1 Tax=Pseudomonas sp. TaxID=306 RepID=UPI003242CD76
MNNLQLFFREFESRLSLVSAADDRSVRNLHAQYADGMIYGAMISGLIDFDQWDSLHEQIVACKLAPLGAAA